MSRDVLKEELMASSAAHCQQWVAQVRRVQQQAHQQRRPTSSTSTRSGASPVAPLPSPMTSHVELDGPARPTSPRAPSPLRRQVSCDMSGSELEQTDAASSPARHSRARPSSSSSASSSAISYTLPESLAAVATAASCRVRERCDPSIRTSELDCTVDSSSCSPAPVFEPVARSEAPSSLVSSISSVSTAVPTSTWRRGSTGRVSSPHYSSSSSESESPHLAHRRSHRSRNLHDSRELEEVENNRDEEREPTRYRRRSFRRSSELPDERRASGAKLTASSLSSRASPPYRLSTRTRQSPGWFTDLPREDEREGESSQAELHILQRVESALRALELENAQAKARERELVQELQTLRDTARVSAAERKHIEQEYRHARREMDSWRRAAQGAEASAAQLQEQLGIAREENQLLASEKLRLKRQNNELLTQVHRLDSLVYGRF
jgi:hypothetical protein